LQAVVGLQQPQQQQQQQQQQSATATAAAAAAVHTQPAGSAGTRVLTRRVIDLLTCCILSQCCQWQQQGDKGDDFAVHGCSEEAAAAADPAWGLNEMGGVALVWKIAALRWCTEGLMALSGL
jgi:hypothetical protein